MASVTGIGARVQNGGLRPLPEWPVMASESNMSGFRGSAGPRWLCTVLHTKVARRSGEKCKSMQGACHATHVHDRLQPCSWDAGAWSARTVPRYSKVQGPTLKPCIVLLGLTLQSTDSKGLSRHKLAYSMVVDGLLTDRVDPLVTLWAYGEGPVPSRKIYQKVENT